MSSVTDSVISSRFLNNTHVVDVVKLSALESFFESLAFANSTKYSVNDVFWFVPNFVFSNKQSKKYLQLLAMSTTFPNQHLADAVYT